MTAVNESIRSSRRLTLLGSIGLIMLPPFAFGALVTGLWFSYCLIHTLGFVGAWAVSAAALLIVRLVMSRGVGVGFHQARRLLKAGR